MGLGDLLGGFFGSNGKPELTQEQFFELTIDKLYRTKHSKIPEILAEARKDAQRHYEGFNLDHAIMQTALHEAEASYNKQYTHRTIDSMYILREVLNEEGISNVAKQILEKAKKDHDRPLSKTFTHRDRSDYKNLIDELVKFTS